MTQRVIRKALVAHLLQDGAENPWGAEIQMQAHHHTKFVPQVLTSAMLRGGFRQSDLLLWTQLWQDLVVD